MGNSRLNAVSMTTGVGVPQTKALQNRYPWIGVKDKNRRVEGVNHGHGLVIC
jgi:hypothetical protein